MPATAGLRERKKQQTRRTLIVAALDLAEEQGYEHTTVEQIADRAEVSARTFARYFPTKDSVILSVLAWLAAGVREGLRDVPGDVSPFDALLRATLSLLDRTERAAMAMRPGRLLTVLRVVHSSPSMQAAAADVWSTSTAAALAERIGDVAGDRTIQLISGVWSAILTSAWSELGALQAASAVTAETLPGQMATALIRAYDDFAEVAGNPRR